MLSSSMSTTESPSASSIAFVKSKQLINGDWRKGLRFEERIKCLLESLRFQKYVNTKIEFEVGDVKSASGMKLLSDYALLLVAKNYGFAKFLAMSQPVKLPKLSPKAFKIMLKFIYTKRIAAAESESGTNLLCDILHCAKMVGFASLAKKCRDQIESRITTNNVTQLYVKFEQIQEANLLKRVVMDVIAKNITEILGSPKFVQLSREELHRFLCSEGWSIAETEVFEMTARWAEHKLNISAPTTNQFEFGSKFREELGQALFAIRFPLFNLEQFMEIHSNYNGLILPQEATAIVRYISQKEMNLSNPPQDPHPFNGCVRKSVLPQESPASKTSHSVAIKREANVSVGNGLSSSDPTDKQYSAIAAESSKKTVAVKKKTEKVSMVGKHTEVSCDRPTVSAPKRMKTSCEKTRGTDIPASLNLPIPGAQPKMATQNSI